MVDGFIEIPVPDDIETQIPLPERSTQDEL